VGPHRDEPTDERRHDREDGKMEDDFKIEGIDVNSLDDAGKKLYSQLEGQFKGAYTKKTQALSEEKKAWEAEQRKLSEEAQEYKRQLDGFNGWWASLTPQQQNYYATATPGEQEDILADRGLTHPDDAMADLQSVAQDLKGLRQWGEAKFSEYERKIGALESSMPLFMDLTDFRFKHPEADWKRVMERAKKDGIRNFDLAYQLEYGEELKEKEVEERVTRKMQEETSKKESEAKLPEFTPGTPIFSPEAKEKPADSWSGASARFRESAAALPGKPA
jgi:hypothetical protein